MEEFLKYHGQFMTPQLNQANMPPQEIPGMVLISPHLSLLEVRNLVISYHGFC